MPFDLVIRGVLCFCLSLRLGGLFCRWRVRLLCRRMSYFIWLVFIVVLLSIALHCYYFYDICFLLLIHFSCFTILYLFDAEMLLLSTSVVFVVNLGGCSLRIGAC